MEHKGIQDLGGEGGTGDVASSCKKYEAQGS